MPQIDLAPAALRLAAVVAAVRDDQLGLPTPCPDYTVGDLLDHVAGLGDAFAAAARKETGPDSAPPPTPDVANLADDWRGDIAESLGRLAEAWRPAEAWEGMTRVGGVDLPGEVCALVGLNEMVVHGWDLARATGQPANADPEALAALLPILGGFAPPPGSPRGDGPFGPQVPVAASASLMEQVIGLTGRDPSWAPDHAGARN